MEEKRDATLRLAKSSAAVASIREVRVRLTPSWPGAKIGRKPGVDLSNTQFSTSTPTTLFCVVSLLYLRSLVYLLATQDNMKNFSKFTSKTCTTALMVVAPWLIASGAAQAGTVSVSYSFSGALQGTPVVNGNFLTVEGIGTGTVDDSNPAVNNVLNPVTLDTFDDVNLTTGINNGTFTMTFANGDTVSGTLYENDQKVNINTATGPITQTLTFTSGTGLFAGINGSTNSTGSLVGGAYSLSGSGTLTAPALVTPEPQSLLLAFGGVALLATRFRKTNQR